MSKKTRKNKKQTLRRKLIIIISVAVALIAIAAVAYGIYARHYNDQNHAENLSSSDRSSYNYALTAFGRTNSIIGDKDVLVLDTISKELGGDSQITFVIYRYSSESDLNDALKMSAEQIAQDARFEYVGTGTVALVDDEIAGMSNMKATYIK